MDSKVNPYESPKSRASSVGIGIGHYRPHLSPCDAFDWVWVFATSAVGVAIGCALSVAATVLAQTYSIDPLYGLSMLLLVALAVCAVCSRWFIQSVSIGATGVELRRFFGASQFLPWEAIREIRPATRRELLYDALCTPWTCTMSCALGKQYRIEWRHGCFFFPPREGQPFAASVAAGLKEWELTDSV